MDERAATSSGGQIVLLTLASAQFLMALDSSVMNVSIATVAKDVGTTVTGIQLAITLYTLVMAAFMITGGKVGQILGRKRAFMIGCVIYAGGSLTTALAGSLPVLILGWSFLEGIGAVLILPSVVALGGDELRPVRSPPGLRPGRLGCCDRGRRRTPGRRVVHDLPQLARRVRGRGRDRHRHPRARPADDRCTGRPRRAARSDRDRALGRRPGNGRVRRHPLWHLGHRIPKPDAPHWFGLSPVVWLILGGGVVLVLFALWEGRQLRASRPVLLDPSMLRVPVLQAGLISFFFQYLLQAGLFFVVPLFLSVALGLSAVATGVRLLPLSLTLLLAAVGVPRLFPRAMPRRVVRIGFAMLFLGIVVLLAVLDEGSGPEVVTWPLLLIGLGIGALASQLGAVTVSAVPDSQSGEVGGVQNTFTNLGASIGTALAGAVLISVLTTTFLGTLANDPAVPKEMSSQAQVQLSAGIPFVSDADLSATLEKAGVPASTAKAVVDDNATSRINGLRAALAVLAFMALLGLVLTRRLPTRQPGAATPNTDSPVVAT